MSEKDVVDKALDVIQNERINKYGKPERNFDKIADLWNAYLHNYTGKPELIWITAQDVGVMMALLKIARISTGVQQQDSYVDAIGYLKLSEEISRKEQDED